MIENIFKNVEKKYLRWVVSQAPVLQTTTFRDNISFTEYFLNFQLNVMQLKYYMIHIFCIHRTVAELK